MAYNFVWLICHAVGYVPDGCFFYASRHHGPAQNSIRHDSREHALKTRI